jgi:hypothetical protein
MVGIGHRLYAWVNGHWDRRVAYENAVVRAAREGGATIAPGAKTIYSNREAI